MVYLDLVGIKVTEVLLEYLGRMAFLDRLEGWGQLVNLAPRVNQELQV